MTRKHPPSAHRNPSVIPISEAEQRNHNAIVPLWGLRNREGLAIVITTCVLLLVAVRSTAAEKKFRVSTVYGHLCNGWSRGQILEYAENEWGISNSATDKYIAEARESELIKTATSPARPSLLNA